MDEQQNVPGKPVPDCGTSGTPPCPPPNVFFETRALVIDRLAGPDAHWEHRRVITAQVDTYLQAALRSAFVLLQGLQVHGAEVHDRGDGLLVHGAVDGSPSAPGVGRSTCCGCCG